MLVADCCMVADLDVSGMFEINGLLFSFFFFVVGFPFAPWLVLTKGPELIHYSRFAKEGKEMKFMRYLYDDTRTLYDVFRRGARVSSKSFFFFFPCSYILIIIIIITDCRLLIG